MGEPAAFLTQLAASRRVAQGPQNEAWVAIRFVYRQVLEKGSRSLAAGRNNVRSVKRPGIALPLRWRALSAAAGVCALGPLRANSVAASTPK